MQNVSHTQLKKHDVCLFSEIHKKEKNCAPDALGDSCKRLAKPIHPDYCRDMVLIRFADRKSKRRALEALAGEFSFKSWSSGAMLLPEEALTLLAREDIPFSFEGSAA